MENRFVLRPCLADCSFKLGLPADSVDDQGATFDRRGRSKDGDDSGERKKLFHEVHLPIQTHDGRTGMGLRFRIGGAELGGCGQNLGWMLFACSAVLFDLDGTLISSIAAVDRSWTAFCVRHGLDVSFVLPQIHGRRSIDSIRALLPHVDAEEEDAWIRNCEATDTEGVFSLLGAIDFVRSLTVDWAVVTSGTSDVARARLKAAGIPEPKVAVFGEDVRHGKPSPEPFLLGAKRLGIAPERCVAFEDTVAGIRSAHAANMKVIALSTSTEVSHLVEADAVVPDFRKLRFEQGTGIRIVED